MESSPGAFALDVAGHAAIGCASQAAQGGSCGAGALSAGAGAVADPIIYGAVSSGQGANASIGERAEGAAASAVVGGVTSVLGGGKFANGAVTAAFGYLFNETGNEDGRPGQISSVQQEVAAVEADEIASGEIVEPTDLLPEDAVVTKPPVPTLSNGVTINGAAGIVGWGQGAAGAAAAIENLTAEQAGAIVNQLGADNVGAIGRFYGGIANYLSATNPAALEATQTPLLRAQLMSKILSLTGH